MIRASAVVDVKSSTRAIVRFPYDVLGYQIRSMIVFGLEASVAILCVPGERAAPIPESNAILNPGMRT